jgi:PAS domain S-box-containing protein
VKLLGLTSEAEVLGRHMGDFLLNPGDRSLFMEKVRDIKGVAEFETVIKRPDGKHRFCLESAHCNYGSDGRVLEIQGLIKDITERIKNEQMLWKTNMELAETNQNLKHTQALLVQQEKMASIGQLAAGVAHEINNPLGFLKSNHASFTRYLGVFMQAWDELRQAAPESAVAISEKYELGYIHDETKKMIAESDMGYDRIMRIITNLKNFARMDVNAEFKPYDLNAGLESSLTLAWNEIKYVATVDRNLGEIPLVPSLSSEINQVLLNILVNSAQAIAAQKREGKGTIWVTTYAAGDYVVCEIKDDGPGIPEEIIGKIFDPFFTTKEPGKGTGLGLSISYDIVVNKCQGRLTASSPPGTGAVFKIELPIHPQKTSERIEILR